MLDNIEEEQSNKINIKDLNKADVLRALYNAFIPNDISPMSQEDADAIIKFFKEIPQEDENPITKLFKRNESGKLYFDCICGQPLEIDITGNTFNAQLYDENTRSDRKAAEVINELREKIQNLSTNLTDAKATSRFSCLRKS